MEELEEKQYNYIKGWSLYCPKCECDDFLTWEAHHLYDIGDMYWLAECKCGAQYRIHPTGFNVVFN